VPRTLCHGWRNHDKRGCFEERDNPAAAGQCRRLIVGWTEVVRALGKLGWVVVVQKGSHAQLKRPDGGGRVTVPLHAGETLGPGLLRSILNQAGITADELRAVL
jgi:predicted RNA binding protein YcfA (HicA-like mRNA interferase family)